MTNVPIFEFEFLTLRLMILDGWTLFVMSATTVAVLILLLMLIKAITRFVEVTRS